MKKTISLCMIVKDESHVIIRCLESIYPYIDRYDITDTGSTDGTQKIIESFFKDKNIPGKVYQSDWKGFAKSRTEAFQNAKGNADYAWTIDADDYIDGEITLPKELDADTYSFRIKGYSVVYWRDHLFNLKHDWEFVGIIHSYSRCGKENEDNFIAGRIHGMYHIESTRDGGRNVGVSDEKKYSKNAAILLDALTNPLNENYDPINKRYMFYLANSYKDAGNNKEAILWYEKRIKAGGWKEEIWQSMYNIGLCEVEDRSKAKDYFLRAYNFDNAYAEPLYALARICRIDGNYAEGCLYAEAAMKMKMPEKDLFIDSSVYEYRGLFEFSICSSYIGRRDEAKKANDLILSMKNVDEVTMSFAVNNAKYLN